MEKSLVYGYHAVTARVRQAPASVSKVYLAENKQQHRLNKLIKLLEQHHIQIEFCQRDYLQSQLGDVVHQGIMAVTSPGIEGKKAGLDQAITQMSANETVLLLDGVQDPMNLGSCLRVADAAGVRHVILPKDKSSPVTMATRKVAVGAVETLHIHTVTNLVRTIERLKQQGFWMIGMTDRAVRSIYDYQFDGRTALILGNEAKGLRHLTQKNCDELLAIPMHGQVESLNVATATAVSLFEVCRQKMHHY